MLVGFFNYRVGMGEPGQVVGDLDTENVEALEPFYFAPVDVDRGMFSFTLSEVDDNLLRFVDIEGEIMFAAIVHQIISLIPELCLVNV